MRRQNFSYKRESKQNPYIGITSFQHFRRDVMYSDLVVKPENNMTETEHVECYPVPSYVKENGRNEGYYPDTSVVYIRILWKEFEPFEGEYNYAFIEDILKKARENEQTVMFRIMQHSTRESDDVPDWLKEKIECPKRPEGMRVKECPSDPKFLEYFGRAVRAFGERFDSDPTLAFMDVSLPGSWGEGSHVDLFTDEQLSNFVDIYTDVFKNTMLIGQTCIPWLVHHSNEKTRMGWRADCIGHPRATYERMPGEVAKMGDIWKHGHVSFESYWWLCEWQRKEWDPDRIFETLLSWHASTFNPKSMPIPYEWQDKVDAFVDKLGYHFTINYVECEEKVKSGEAVRIKLGVENVGVAPIYTPLPLYVKIKSSSYERVYETDVDVRRWIEGKYEENLNVCLDGVPAGKYELQLGLGGGDKPSAVFASDARLDGDYSVVAEIEIL